MGRNGKNLSVYLTHRADGSKWWLAAWRDPASKKRVVRTTGVRFYPERRDGGHWEAQQAALKLRDGPEEKKVPTYRELVQGFYSADSPYVKLQEADGKPISSSWRKILTGMIETYCLPKWGSVPLDKLNFLEVKTWLIGVKSSGKKHRKNLLHNQTRNIILYSCFKVPLRYARQRGLIDVNPFAELTVFSVSADRRTRDIFTRDELERLFPQNLLSIWGSEKWATIFLILTTTGIRKGELRALQWKNLLPDGYLNVESAVKADGTIGPPEEAPEGREQACSFASDDSCST